MLNQRKNWLRNIKWEFHCQSFPFANRTLFPCNVHLLYMYFETLGLLILSFHGKSVLMLIVFGWRYCAANLWRNLLPLSQFRGKMTTRNGAECIRSEDKHIQPWSFIVLQYTFYNFSCLVYHSTLKTEVVDSYRMLAIQWSSYTAWAPIIRINIKYWGYLKNSNSKDHHPRCVC